MTVDDPKHYVIQEMVERGVAELLSVLPSDVVCPEKKNDAAVNAQETASVATPQGLNEPAQ